MARRKSGALCQPARKGPSREQGRCGWLALEGTQAGDTAGAAELWWGVGCDQKPVSLVGAVGAVKQLGFNRVFPFFLNVPCPRGRRG